MQICPAVPAISVCQCDYSHAGSVATIKLGLVYGQLRSFADVKVVSTQAANHFSGDAKLPEPILSDEDEWSSWKQIGDPVLHIELRRWADAFVIAPLSANTLAKLANGLSDNLLTCVVRAWDFAHPLLVSWLSICPVPSLAVTCCSSLQLIHARTCD